MKGIPGMLSMFTYLTSLTLLTAFALIGANQAINTQKTIIGVFVLLLINVISFVIFAILYNRKDSNEAD